MYAPPIPIVTRRIYHTVKSGETLTSISKRYGVALEDVKRWNAGVRFAPGVKVALEVRAPVKKAKRTKTAKAKTYRKAER